MNIRCFSPVGVSSSPHWQSFSSQVPSFRPRALQVAWQRVGKEDHDAKLERKTLLTGRERVKTIMTTGRKSMMKWQDIEDTA